MPYMDCMGLATCSKEVSYLSLMRSSKEKKQVIFGKKNTTKNQPSTQKNSPCFVFTNETETFGKVFWGSTCINTKTNIRGDIKATKIAGGFTPNWWAFRQGIPSTHRTFAVSEQFRDAPSPKRHRRGAGDTMPPKCQRFSCNS